MKGCAKIHSLLMADYLDGQISAAQAQEVKRHIAACADCAKLEKELLAQRSLFKQVKQQAVPDQVWEQLRGRIIQQRLSQERPGLWERLRRVFVFPRPELVLAGSLFSVIIITAMFFNVSTQKQALLNKQAAAAKGIAGYNLGSYMIYDLGTGIERYFL